MKKGFTLVEVLAVIAVVGVIALIAYPAVDNTIKNAREKAYRENIKSIKDAAFIYSTTNDIGYSTSYQALQIEVLKNAGLLTEKDIINPVDDSVIEGCVLYRWITAKNQYEFEYSSDCVNPE